MYARLLSRWKGCIRLIRYLDFLHVPLRDVVLFHSFQILSAGSIGSPQLLQLSGIGPGALLQQHGIAVRHDAPGVGANLQDHLQIRTVFTVSGVKTLNTQANSLWGKAMIALEYALKRTGPMSMAPSQLGAFTRSDPAQPWPNIHCTHCQVYS